VSKSDFGTVFMSLIVCSDVAFVDLLKELSSKGVDDVSFVIFFFFYAAPGEWRRGFDCVCCTVA
jgi:hypothetical protein